MFLPFLGLFLPGFKMKGANSEDVISQPFQRCAVQHISMLSFHLNPDSPLKKLPLVPEIFGCIFPEGSFRHFQERTRIWTHSQFRWGIFLVLRDWFSLKKTTHIPASSLRPWFLRNGWMCPNLGWKKWEKLSLENLPNNKLLVWLLPFLFHFKCWIWFYLVWFSKLHPFTWKCILRYMF